MKNILLIDDNKPILDSLSAYLRYFLRNCTVRTADNGKTAVEIMRSVPIDVILTDLEMPFMNGFELVAYTKTHYPAIPVLVMTGRHSPETEKRAMSIGASQYIIKPFDVEAIKDLISTHIEPRSLVS
jgi:two-component system, NtrC family, response regulator HydG